MITRAERIRLGFFVFFGLLLLLGFLFLTAGKALFKKHDFYYIEYTESVSGLNQGNPVKRRGVEIGTVESLSFSKEDVSKIIVEISVKKGTEIKSDAEATVQVFGITGIKYIDIIRESNASPALKPGDKIRPGLSTIDMVTGKADLITQKIEIALNNVIAMTREENGARLSRMILSMGELANNLNILITQNQDNIRNITSNLSHQSGGMFNRVNLMLARLDSSFSQLNDILSNKSLDRSFRNMETITGEVKDGLGKGKIGTTLDNLNRTLESTNTAVSQFNKTLSTNRERLNQIMDRLEMTTRNLADFTQKIKENPSMLIRNQEE